MHPIKDFDVHEDVGDILVETTLYWLPLLLSS